MSASPPAAPPRPSTPPRAARLPAIEVRVETQGAVQPLEADGRRLLDALRELAPDVVVLSRALSDAEAIRVLRALRASGCRAAITFERRTGARPRAVTPVVAHVGPRADAEVGTADPAAGAHPDADGPLRARYGLSARECVVARLVASGATNREIAQALALSPFTARNHTSRVLRKLGARNRARVAALLGA